MGLSVRSFFAASTRQVRAYFAGIWRSESTQDLFSLKRGRPHPQRTKASSVAVASQACLRTWLRPIWYQITEDRHQSLVQFSKLTSLICVKNSD